ncbi:MAG: sulfotransferase [Myxococcota bacterium]
MGSQHVHKAVFVAGAGHSGSTLLGHLLGNHAQAFYAGEAKKSIYIGDSTKPLRKRICKLCGEDCPLWSRFDPESKLHLYQQLAHLSGRSVVVDSTKSIEWIERQRRTLPAQTEAYLLFLTRDGRAVVNSRVRKYPNRQPSDLIDDWRRQIEATEQLMQRFDGDTYEIRYEKLATEPEVIMRNLCNFLGLRYTPSMLRFDASNHHPLGGNNGTQFLMSRAQGQDPNQNALGDRIHAYYGSHPAGIQLDLRWRSELPDEVLRLFEKRAGTLNLRFRWP